MTNRRITVAQALVGNDYQPSGPVAISIEAGRIVAIHPAQDSAEEPRILAISALVDGHNHARPLSPTSFGSGMKPLESWLPSLAGIPAVDPYLAAAASFGRSARGGCVGVMVHLIRPMGREALTSEVHDYARAASDVGVSIGFAVAMRDRNPIVYGDHSALAAKLSDRFAIDDIWRTETMSPEDQVKRVSDVAAEIEDQAHVDVQFGPNGVQWCSDRLLEAIAGASAETGRRVHMHLLETREQRKWADRTYPGGIVQRLEEIGLLSPRLTVAHCVWARPDELLTMARHGVRIAVNPSSNLHLGSGIAHVGRMKAAGVHVGLGLDGCAFDEDDDALRELRLFRLLNAGVAFEEITPTDAMEAACVTGREIIGLAAGGRIEIGMPADLVLLDLDRLDRDRIMDVDPRHYLFARATQQHIVEVITGGRTIVRTGHVLGLDLDATEEALRQQYREAIGSTRRIREAFAALEPLIGEHYRGCC
ncbi:amidohydrolase family protein [Rhizobium sp. CFBP 8752]|uniref:amidohydrolase family protein n=1 Tax=Rhizobium sp. CFBP 8752 TaxID=2775301 RepID=UPI0017869959|nr:amidohydrolase family protein [Rhizobium sp. CFBP 8752]MBD8664249.1 amidohydrolase family protein [Rhizobium sp. CFBP 8752]